MTWLWIAVWLAQVGLNLALLRLAREIRQLGYAHRALSDYVVEHVVAHEQVFDDHRRELEALDEQIGGKS